MNLTLAFSTCPNDTYIFDALVNKRIDVGTFAFDVVLADIQELNKLAFNGQVDIIKISYALYPFVSHNYQLLNSGSALGRGVGPLVVSRRKIFPDELTQARIAIPGKHTTANLLFTLAYPSAALKKSYLFSDIEDVVLADEADVGVIIHENRFTYHKKGLKKIVDLGEFWEAETGLPIPLGGIAVRRSLGEPEKKRLNDIVRRSVEHAFAFPKQSYPYVKNHAQTMDDSVIQNHIDLYVNNFSVDLGDGGREAAVMLFEKSVEAGYSETAKMVLPFFV